MEWGKFSTQVSFLVTHFLLKQSGRRNVWLRWPGWFLARFFDGFLPPFSCVFVKTKPKELASHIQSPFVGHHRVWFGTWRGNVRVEFHLKSSPDLFFFFSSLNKDLLLLQQQPPTPTPTPTRTRTRTTKMLPAERANDAKELIFITLERVRKKDQNVDSRNQPPFLGDFPSRLFAVSW